MKRIHASLACSALLSLVFAGSALADPPDWAPAHGYRAKHQYVYYPAHRIYYEPAAQTWFWFDGGGWRVGAVLPLAYEQYTHGGVTIDIDADRPYERQAWVEETYGRPVVIEHRHRDGREYEYDRDDDRSSRHGNKHKHQHDDD